MSCGIASLMMCVFKINKLTPGAASVTVEKDIYQKYSQVMGSGYSPETTGTYPQYLATVLNSFTSGTWHWHNYAPTDVPQQLLDKVGLTAGLGAVVNVEPVILGWTGTSAARTGWSSIRSVRHSAANTPRSAIRGTPTCTCSPSVSAAHSSMTPPLEGS